MRAPKLTSAMSAALLLVSCGGSADDDASPEPTIDPANSFANVTFDRLKRADETPQEWLSYGGNYEEQRHSLLTQINIENVSDLGVAWTYDLATGRGVESAPIVVDGVMYVTSAWSIVYALDAKTGEELWVYDPDVDGAVAVRACCDVVNRGVAVYEGKIFLGVIDGRLEALDAKTGEVVWSKITVDQSKPYTITGAPRVVDGKVYIGNGGAELGVRGYVSAYDVEDGSLIWRFYTVPSPDKAPDGAASDEVFRNLANASWGDTGAWKTDGGGGTVWDSIIYDEANHAIIFGVGNGSPWNQRIRDPAGLDNLFLSSIVAVDADTGAYKWHFQTTPGDSWDYTATQSLILADLPLGEDGAPRRIVMQAPKNGYFYVLDAATGAFIHGAGYVPQNWTTGLTERGRPIEVPEARYEDGAYLQTPGAMGAHNWHPMAFSPDTGLAYIPAQQIPQVYINDPRFAQRQSYWNTGSDFAADIPNVIPIDLLKFFRGGLKGQLIAWDPVENEPRWAFEHDGPWNGGILSTAGGIVFQGKLNGEFAGYNATTGEELWVQNVKSGVASGPGTYAIDGEQFVAVTTGWGSAYALAAGFAFEDPVGPSVGKVVAFSLGATGAIADPEFPEIDRSPRAEPFGTTAQLEEGLVHFARNCSVCHGPFAISSGVLPDLRWSAYTATSEAWSAVLVEGVLKGNGMVPFADILSAEEIEAIRAYVVQQAHNPPEPVGGAQ